jgi:hypothetical protein
MNFADSIAHEQRMRRYQQQYSPVNPITEGRKQAGDSDPLATWDKNQEAAETLVEIKKQFSKLVSSPQAHKITKAYLDIYAQTQDSGVLHKGLEMVRKVARFTDNLDQLGYQGTTRHVPKVTSTTRFSPFGSRVNNINQSGCFGTDANVERDSYLNDAREWLQNYQKQSSCPSTTSINLAGILPSSVASPASPMRIPPTPNPNSQYPPSSSRCRTANVESSQTNKTTFPPTSSTQEQQSPNTMRAHSIKNQEYFTDPFYSYFGVSKEQFWVDFLAWQQETFLPSRLDPLL